MSCPNSIANNHRRPHPCNNGKPNSPINEKVCDVNSNKWYIARSNFVAYYRILLIELNVRRNVTQHDIPGVDYYWNENQVDNLVDDVVVEFSIVVDHVVQIYAFAL